MSLLSFTMTGMVGLAGALGALSRYLIGRFIAEHVPSQFPLATLLINITGSFIIGLLFALAGQKLISSTLQIVLATGFLGGYTTFSTMSWEAIQLVRSGKVRQSLLYLGGNILLGFSSAALGLLLGGLL